MGDSLEQYLTDLTEGRLDSDGVFEIDPVAAGQKEAGSRHEPSLWLLKAIQAGVCANAPEVIVRVKRQTVAVEFEPGTLPAGLGHLLAARMRPGDLEEGQRRFLSHLKQAFSLAGLVERGEVELILAEGGQVTRLDQARGRALVAQEPASGEGPRVILQLRRAPASWLERLLNREAAHLHRTLERRFGLAPIPIRLDGRVINHGCPHLLDWGHPWPPFKLIGGGIADGKQGFRWLADYQELREGDAAALAPFQERPCCLAQRAGTSTKRVPIHQHTVFAALGVIAGTESARLHEAGYSAADPSWYAPASGDILLKARVGIGKAGPLITAATWISGDPSHLSVSLSRGLRVWHGGAKEVVDQYPTLQVPFLRVGRYCALSILPTDSSHLLIVSDGLALDPIPVNVGPPGSKAIVADSRIGTDWSLLKPIQGDRWHEHLNWMHSKLGDLQGNIRDVLDDSYLPEFVHLPQDASKAWGEYFSQNQQV